jgi:hypothetical protein
MNLLSFLSQPTNHAARRAAAMPRPSMLAEPETIPAAPLYPAPKTPPTPDVMCEAFYSGCSDCYSPEFRQGFRHMAAALCRAKMDTCAPTIGTAAYDAWQYGVQECHAFFHSPEWQQAIAS